EWTGPTLNLAWDGSTYETVTRSFVGRPVTVPGDRVQRTLAVRNSGPSDGVLRAWVTAVDLRDPEGPGAPGPSDGDEFYEDLRLLWSTASGSGSASFRELERTGTLPIALTP